MKLGIIGLPQSGKTTVFNALTRGNAPTGAMLGGGRFEVHTAVVPVPDPRVDKLSAIFKPHKTIYAQVTYADVAGIESNPSARIEMKGPLLGELRQMDGLLHVADISWARVNKPADVLTVGQTVDVQILKVDPKKRRVSLGMKQLLAQPWTLAGEK